MSQETNLNVSPYFDDYNEPVIGGKAKDYYKVLFKPGYPVQARELTTLQSMLQNQIEQFGNHFFKEGAKVIPGNLTYIQDFHSIEVESNFLGIPVSLYLDNLVGLQIRGERSGVVAIVKKVITSEESERGNITLYVDYYQSNIDNSGRAFIDAENLITDSSINFGNSFITAGEGFARTIATNAADVGSAFAIANGIYFLRGYLVEVHDEILILDQYSNIPSYRVGLDVIEDIVTADLDPYLNDNANGFNNYAAPGADRLKISARLSKKPIDQYEYPNFVELASVRDGILRKINTYTNYNLLADELARRTFDESGNYYIKAFDVFCKESLNDGKGNGGIYNRNQLTSTGQKPSEDLMVYKIGPGKAYVRGYECEIIGPSLVNSPKTRETNELSNQGLNFTFGSTLELNRASGAPSIGINTSANISLRNARVGINSYIPAGKEIGIARLYDYALESGSYELENLNLNRWDISLFDIQTYGDLQVNTDVTLTIPTYIKGDSSGATAFLKNAVTAGTALTVYQVSGNFINGERLIFDNTTESRVSIGWTNYGISAVKSLHASVGAASTFSADTILKVATKVGNGNADITPFSAGIATVTSPLTAFPGIVTSGNLIQYTRPNFDVKSYAKVDIVNTNSLIISGIATVTGVADGGIGIGASGTSVNDLSVLRCQLKTSKNSESLFAPLPKKNVKSVDLTGSSVVLRKEYDGISIASNSTSSIVSGTNLVFLPFDEERYVLVRSNGTIETLNEDKFQFNSGMTELTINGLGDNDTGARLIATVTKSSLTAKSKKKSVIEISVLDKSTLVGSGIGVTSRNDGLTYGNYPYGTRVQDDKICLNVPDVVRIYGIYESTNTSDPVLPNVTLQSLDGPTAKTDDLIIGEEFIGAISGARGIYAKKESSSKISFTYLNSFSIESGEVIEFLDSGVNGIAITLDEGSTNVTENFTTHNGQTFTHYDYSYIKRKESVKIPTKKLKVVYAKGYYESSDTGDITTINSYEGFDYKTELWGLPGYRNSDIVDVRPRVNDYVVTEGSTSPFEFAGRSFADGNHSSQHVFASDESEIVTFEYYLPRLDRLYLTKDGVFQLKFGEPSDNPKLPEAVSDAINVANLAVPPYLYNTNDVQISYVKHKRYQMSDISKLERRINHLEYYTTLSLLESNTADLFIADSLGQNRFKSGYLIDNFSSVGTQDVSVGVKNSVDLQRGQLRPSHYTTSLNLELGSDAIAGLGTTSNTNQDHNFLQNITGTNIKRTGSVISLDYDDVLWLEQPYATRVENVTPYLVMTWRGSITLDPTADVWIDVNRMELRDVEMEGSFLGVAEALRAEVTTAADGSRSGLTEIIWNSWQTDNISHDLGMTLDVDVSTSSSSSWQPTSAAWDFGGNRTAHANGAAAHGSVTGTQQAGSMVSSTTTDVSVNGSVSLSTDLEQSRTGVQHSVREQIDTESLGDRIVSRNIIYFMRSRNIEFTAKSMKPNTQLYGFFDDVDVNEWLVPKLLEITMTSGTFQVGETVLASVVPAPSDTTSIPSMSFRVANSNHKYGPYNAPTDLYDQNPYDRNNSVPGNYSTTSTTLNIDTFSLASEQQPQFAGWARSGMLLQGQSSGATATISNYRLLSDRVGTLIGSYFIPDGNIPGNPTFETGRSIFRLTNSSTNDRTGGVVTTSAEEIFYSQGDIDNTQEVTLSLRNARVTQEDFRETRVLNASATATAGDTTSSTSSSTVENVVTAYNINGQDPLAQSFFVDDVNGIFVTKLNLYFRSKDPVLPVTCQIREIRTGLPTNTILGFADIEIPTQNVNISDDATAETTVTFDSPVYLNGDGTQYALVLLSESTEYTVWISRLGEPDVKSAASEAGQILVTQQPLLGSLYKSQNASVWTPSQYEDLKFQLFRADFETQGSVQFFNPPLPTDISLLRTNPFSLDSKTIRIGIGTTVQDADLDFGNTITQLKSGATANYVGSAGTAKTLQITNAGIGYTPSSGATTYSNLTLTNLNSGTGKNGTANITISAGVAVAATVSDGGTGYSVGDYLTVSSIGIASVGRDLRLSVSQIDGFNELIVNNVQGTFTVGAGYTLTYQTSAGLTTTLNSAYSGGVIVTQPVEEVHDGLHFKIDMRNHGMHSDVNKVTVSNAQGNIIPTEINTDYSASSTGNISLASTANFTEFENVAVGATNPGYIKIGNEIISYTGHASNELTGVTREIDGTKSFAYTNGQRVHKYEMNGVSLLRINKTHDLNEGSIDEQIGLDYFYLKVDDSSGTNITDRTGTVGWPSLLFNETGSFGGSNVKATYNVPFEIITPEIVTITPVYTTVSSSVRTISAKSIDGTESPYVDKGFQPVTLNALNYFSSPRMVASKVNEDARLTTLPGKKSFTMNMNLISSDSKLSPQIDLTRTNIIFTSNRVNRPITDYVNDERANTIADDPNKCFYVSKPVVLTNSATAIKVMLTASISEENDIRAFYQIHNSVDGEVSFTPFPGHSNLTDGRVIDSSKNTGSPDTLIAKNDFYDYVPGPRSFREYEWTIDELPSFKVARIKLVMTSTSQSIVPIIQDLRVIALA